MKKKNLYRNIPKVDDLLNHELIKDFNDSKDHTLIKESINQVLNNLRKEIGLLKDDAVESFDINNEKIVKKAIQLTLNFKAMNLKNVINGTGIVIHTNLGRSNLSEEIAKEAYDIATGYSNLEFDLNSGKRGHRYNHIEELICYLTGAEGALVVNNNAAAVMLVLDTLAKDQEAIVSRGELVEIGGSFRVPDVMKRSGTLLREIGTTNKTHYRDYEQAINENTGVILKVHTSNYRILGFSETVPREELVSLGEKYKIPVYEDLGSGLLFDFSNYMTMDEPTVKEIVESGIDVISFSGDKMLGGPQAGIIVGKKKYIEAMKYNQLTRALRVDKMTFAALEATLRAYLDPERVKLIPTIKNIIVTKEEIYEKAKRLKSILDDFNELSMDIKADQSQVGGGSLPLTLLDTYVLSIRLDGVSPNSLSNKLRLSKYPIVGRINNDQYLLDLRTIDTEDFDLIKNSFKDILSGGKNV